LLNNNSSGLGGIDLSVKISGVSVKNGDLIFDNSNDIILSDLIAVLRVLYDDRVLRK